MAHLFNISNGVVTPTEEVLLIEPFKTIWEMDKSKNKAKAIKDFSFIEFMTSKQKTNPYAGYSESKRYEKLVEAYYEPNWEPSTLIEQAMSKIVDFQKNASVTYRYYDSAVNAAEKMIDFFNTFSLSQTNERGQLLYKPADITRALNDTNKVLENLNNMKKKVEAELFNSGKTLGEKIINPFEI